VDKKLEDLGGLMYEKFKADLENRKATEEEKITGEFAKRGFPLPQPGLYSAIIDLHINKIRELYQKRMEIDKRLLSEKYGYIPDSEIEGLRMRASEIINQEMERLKNGDYFGKKLERGMMSYIDEIKKSFLINGKRDAEIERGLSQLSLEKEKRERFSLDYIDVLMQIFRFRDNVNTHFKNRFGFDIFKLEQEGVIPEIIKPCEIESDFVTKIAVLGNLIDWINVNGLKLKIKGETKGLKSISLLEEFLKQQFGSFEEKIIKNLRVISELRNKKFPIHKEGQEVIEIFIDLGEKYPPENWDMVWKKVMAIYLESLKGLIGLF
jgi:hypothetical protein